MKTPIRGKMRGLSKKTYCVTNVKHFCMQKDLKVFFGNFTALDESGEMEHTAVASETHIRQFQDGSYVVTYPVPESHIPVHQPLLQSRILA